MNARRRLALTVALLLAAVGVFLLARGLNGLVLLGIVLAFAGIDVARPLLDPAMPTLADAGEQLAARR